MSTFPPTLWASTDISFKRTTNGCEAFHRKLNGLFYHSHPSIFELVDRLEEFVFETSFKMREGPARPPKANERRKQAWLESIIANYQAETVTTEQFRKRFVRHLCQTPPCKETLILIFKYVNKAVF
ncbi:phosphoglucomutase-3 [Elysia marginata]|uniref:Phosphoglucomutase-3 n=1 Tax=Elysia marginata TaxID=1093978 RepID=A0AAV4ESF2_9GAST|nr:phosphoglucomutase-3 [Elysia marginata]